MEQSIEEEFKLVMLMVALFAAMYMTL